MNSYPVGNQVICRFAFTNRPLTPAEYDTFVSGGGLPAGVGVDQVTVSMGFRVNDTAAQTLSGGEIVHDGVGQYHGVVTTSVPGRLSYWGTSVDGSSNPVAATVTSTFNVTAH